MHLLTFEGYFENMKKRSANPLVARNDFWSDFPDRNDIWSDLPEEMTSDQTFQAEVTTEQRLNLNKNKTLSAVIIYAFHINWY